MEVWAHLLHGQTKDVTIETSNPLVARQCISTSKMKGVQICTPFINNIEGPNRSTNNNTQTFWQVSSLKGLNLARKQDLDKKWANFFMNQTSFSIHVTFNILTSYESNLRILNLLQTPFISWITHKFVKIIQGQYVETNNWKDAKFYLQIWNNHLFWWLG